MLKTQICVTRPQCVKVVDAPVQVSNISVFVVAFYHLFPSQNVYYFASYIFPSVAAATRPLHLIYGFELFLKPMFRPMLLSFILT